MRYSLVLRTYGENDAFFYLWKYSFSFIKIWNRLIDFEINSKVKLKCQWRSNANRTFKSSKQKGSLFIVQGFRSIVFILIVVFTTFRPICPRAFFGCLSHLEANNKTSNKVLYSIHGDRLFWFRLPGISAKYSCIVTCLHSGLNQQLPDDCLF